MQIQELLAYWQVIKKRWWVISLLVAVTVGTMLFTSYLAEPLYKASTLFQVTAPLPSEVFIFADFRSQTLSAELASTKNNFVALLRNEFVIEQALKEVGLEVDVEKFMEKQLLVEPEEDSAWVKLAVTAEKPKMAADMANTLMDKASHSFGELSAGSLTANKEFIEQQLPEVKKELDEAKLALVQFQMESKFGSLDALINEQQSLIIYLKRRQDEALASDDQLTVDMYDKIIATRELELQELLTLTFEYDDIRARVRRIEEVHSNLLNKKLEAELKENEVMSAKFIRIIPATEPRHPLPRFNIGLLMVGGVVSLAVGVMTAFVLEALGDLSVPDSSDDVIVQEPVLSV
jgi:uncharacterized protein involved in exopolysaccharide biosynthesis